MHIFQTMIASDNKSRGRPERIKLLYEGNKNGKKKPRQWLTSVAMVTIEEDKQKRLSPSSTAPPPPRWRNRYLPSTKKTSRFFKIKKTKNPEGREKKRTRQAEDGNWNREARIEDIHGERQAKIVSEKGGRLAETDTRNSVRHDARSSPLSFFADRIVFARNSVPKDARS